MKNYYKILGVKKNASEEEIREHWVRLMRKLHPDQQTEGAVEDERIKEVNEAYQVLKHSSTRMEYDLKMAYDKKKRGSYFQRLSVPVSILIVLLILGTLYLKKTQMTTVQPVSVTQGKITQIDKKDQIDQRNQTNQTNQKNQRNQIDQRNQRNQRNQVDQIAASTPPPIDLSTHPRTDSIDATTQQRILPLTVDQPNQPNEINQKNQVNQRDASTHPRIDASTPPSMNPAVVSAIQQSERSNAIRDNSTLTVVRMDSPVILIATEEEVGQFFAQYTERYTKKDLEDLLSLFSPRAVQNRRDGLEGIRKIYGNFFDQSQEIKYHLNDLKIEIYQNAVEAKGRYELIQSLKKSGEKKVWRGDIRWTLIKEGGALKILSLDYQPQKSY